MGGAGKDRAAGRKRGGRAAGGGGHAARSPTSDAITEPVPYATIALRNAYRRTDSERAAFKRAEFKRLAGLYADLAASFRDPEPDSADPASSQSSTPDPAG